MPQRKPIKGQLHSNHYITKQTPAKQCTLSGDNGVSGINGKTFQPYNAALVRQLPIAAT